jgi:hypothetical protein
MTTAEVAARFEGKPAGSGEWSARCPAHDDRRASLSIGIGGGGCTVVLCHAGCETTAVLAARQLTLADLFPQKDRGRRRLGKLTKTYPYRDEEGELLFEVCRYDPKDFRQRHRAKPGEKADRAGWSWNMKGIRHVPYRLREILEAVKAGATIYVVEGERDADNLSVLGLAATCNSGGAGKWRSEHTQKLIGAKLVVVIADKDEAGRKHAQHVLACITAAGIDARILELPGEGKDVSDWLGAGGTRGALEAYAAGAPRQGGDQSTAQKQPGGDEGNKSTRCIAYALRLKPELLRSPDGQAFATLPDGRTLVVRSRAFRAWLSKLFWDAEHAAPGGEALSDALGHFEGIALHEGEERDVFVRVGRAAEALYIDLGDNSLSVVQITAAGWQIVQRGPIPFVRPAGLRALPCPVSGGRLDELRGVLNLGAGEAGDERWALISAWLVGTLHPQGPYPVLWLSGEQGSAKSAAARYLRAIVDPSAAPLRSQPREDRDLCIAASNGWIVAFDNLSRVPEWLSDALCRVATGGGLATRALYTDREEALFDIKRPILFTGIDLDLRPDLLDRTLLLSLPPIEDGERREEADLDAAFDAARPRLLGALLDAVVTALQRLPHVRLAKKPRMADFARWAVSAEPALGLKPGAIESALVSNRAGAVELSLEGSPIVGPLREVVVEDSTWTGTATDLLAALATKLSDPKRPPVGWPGNGRALSHALRVLAPNLRRVGFEFTFPSRGGIRTLSIKRTPEPPTQGLQSAPVAPPTPEASEEKAETSGANGSQSDEREACAQPTPSAKTSKPFDQGASGGNGANRRPSSPGYPDEREPGEDQDEDDHQDELAGVGS